MAFNRWHIALCQLICAAFLGALPAHATPYRWPVAEKASEPPTLSSTYGPRLLASDGYRYDFHRGIDIPMPLGSPIYAVGPGKIRIAGDHSGYSDPLIQIEHGTTPGRHCSESVKGCLYSNYMHIQEALVAPGTFVKKGDLIALSGVSASGFAHLHFEMRQGGYYQKHCVHPLHYLPVIDRKPPDLHIQDYVLRADSAPYITIQIQSPANALDVVAARLQLLDPQDPNTVFHDQFFDMEDWNLRFTHQEKEWPAPHCSHAEAHPEGSAYDPNIHMDNPEMDSIYIEPIIFNQSTSTYALRLTFMDLKWPDDIANPQVLITVWDIYGNKTQSRL